MRPSTRFLERYAGLRAPVVATVVLGALVVPVAAGGPLTAGASASNRAEPVRIALLGDSITDGSSGDYTWRYFLDRHLRASGAAVDLVGVRDDLYDLETSGRGQAYADPDFDRDHSAWWGDSMFWPFNPVRPVMTQHRPDVLVHAVAANDLRYWGLSPQQVLAMTEERVEEARAVDPDVDVVLVQVFAEDEQVPRARAFNALLEARVADLATPRSRVVVARADPTYRTSTPSAPADTWDDIHPDTSGQLKYAAAVADALAELGVGVPHPRPFTVPAEGLRSPAVLQGEVGEEAATLWWTPPPGATSHDVWVEDLSAGTPPALALPEVPGTLAEVGGLVPGSTYVFRVLPRKHLVGAEPDMFSNAVVLTVPDAPPILDPTPEPTPEASPSPAPTAGPSPPPAPVPATPPAPADVRAQPARGALRVTWTPVPGATSYLVSVRDRPARSGWHAHPAGTTILRLAGLRAGARHGVRVQALGPGGVSLPSTPVRATPTWPAPGKPRRLRIAGDKELTELRWRRVRQATHYRVSYRPDRPGAVWRTLPGILPQQARRLVLPPMTRGRQVIRVRSFHDLVRGGAATVQHMVR